MGEIRVKRLAVNWDRLTRERRSWNMSRIRGKDTAPEKVVRSLLHRMGYRFRLNVRISIELGKQEGRKIRGGLPILVAGQNICRPRQ
jgi:DNA mismatch endonuclease (patch repair protein)